MIINQVKKDQKELSEYNSYRSFADKFYNTSQLYQKEEKERNEITRTMSITYIDITEFKKIKITAVQNFKKSYYLKTKK